MSLFLSKIEVDHEIAYKLGLKNAYDWHRFVWLAFPDRPRAERDFLTRIDETDNGIRCLIQSAQPPQRPTTCPKACWQSKAIPDAFFSHTHYTFSLLANPTRKLKLDSGGTPLKNGRRVAIRTREDLLAWLERKGRQHGFRIDSKAIQTNPRPVQLFTKKSLRDDKFHAALHTATEFRGVLEVCDPELFADAARSGIGSAKAFGFGMLCLVPS